MAHQKEAPGDMLPVGFFVRHREVNMGDELEKLQPELASVPVLRGGSKRINELPQKVFASANKWTLWHDICGWWTGENHFGNPDMPAIAESLTHVSSGEKQEKTQPAARASLFEFRKPVGRRLKYTLGASAWILFLAGWHLLAISSFTPDALLPTPGKVVMALYDLIAERGFGTDILQSVKRILISFTIALSIALPLGIMMGAFPVVESFLNPLVSPFRYLPAPSFVPLLLMWLGTGDGQKIALLVIGVVWFLVTLLMDNTKAVRQEIVECSRTLGATRKSVIWRVILPASLPSYMDTARQMLAVSWTYLVIAEIVAATDGIGAMMMRAKRFVRVEDILAGILVIGILGLLFDLLFRLLHRLWFRYLY
jgi:NitT/TauT family transport system permease protein